VSATLLGVGLQRFAYAPLLPAMVQAAWLTPEAGGMAGAANFAGYLIGSAAAPAAGRALGLRPALRAAMALAALSLAAAAAPLGTVWFLPWRLAAGVAGGVLMILAGPAVQAAVSPSVRGVAAGMMFTGVGGGILAGALIVPALLPLGVAAVWLALAATAVGLNALSWPLWPNVAAPRHGRSRRLPRAAWGLVAAYAASAVAATPHIVWWPDYVARGLGLGTGAGAAAWVGYGIGAMAGPAVLGRLADRAGTGVAYRVALIGQIAADALPLMSGSVVSLAASTLLAAATMVGLTALTLTRAREISEGEAPAVWRAGTMAWAAAQMATGLLLAWLYAATQSHLPLFALGAGAGVIALLLDRRWASRR
jgi:MFS family permease